MTVIQLSHLRDTFKQADLADLGRLTNLIALELNELPYESSYSTIDLDDRLAMHLGRLAEERCFLRLRALNMSGVVKLTERGLSHLNKLPALTLLSLRESRRTEPRFSTFEITTWRNLTEYGVVTKLM